MYSYNDGIQERIEKAIEKRKLKEQKIKDENIKVKQDILINENDDIKVKQDILINDDDDIKIKQDILINNNIFSRIIIKKFDKIDNVINDDNNIINDERKKNKLNQQKFILQKKNDGSYEKYKQIKSEQRRIQRENKKIDIGNSVVSIYENKKIDIIKDYIIPEKKIIIDNEIIENREKHRIQKQKYIEAKIKKIGIDEYRRIETEKKRKYRENKKL